MWYVAQVQAGRESATRDLCLRLVSPDVLEAVSYTHLTLPTN